MQAPPGRDLHHLNIILDPPTLHLLMIPDHCPPQQTLVCHHATWTCCRLAWPGLALPCLALPCLAFFRILPRGSSHLVPVPGCMHTFLGLAVSRLDAVSLSLPADCVAQSSAWDCSSRQHRGCYECDQLLQCVCTVHMGAQRPLILPCGSAGYRRDNRSHSIPEYRSWMADNPHPSYPSLTTGIQPFLDGTRDYRRALQPRPAPDPASVSPQRPSAGAAGIARPPSQPPSSVIEVLEMYRREVGRTAPAARQGPDDTAPAAAAAATTAETESAHDAPQLRAAPPQPPQHRDFSRLLQSTDQLAEQLQRASERLTYLTEAAGESATHCCRCPAN